jgi:hypothetical protein
MRPAKRSAAGRSPGPFQRGPTFQQHSAAYISHSREPWYAPPAGAVVFADAKPPLAPATKIEGGGWG